MEKVKSKSKELNMNVTDVINNKILAQRTRLCFAPERGCFS